MKTRLTPIQLRILSVLIKSFYPLTTNQVAKVAVISWNTAESYLISFHKCGWVDKKMSGRTIYWKPIISGSKTL